jgi:hypothetical protein
MLSWDFKRIVAVALVASTVLITMPVSAADFSTAKSVIGSISAVGPVELRGVSISQEGTLFAGDSIRAGQKGYAKVLLGSGIKVELSEKTDVKFNRDAQGVKIAMNTGIVGFTASSPLRIDILPFEVTASDGSAGKVAVMSSGAAGVRALNGKVSVRNLKTLESFIITQGQERLLGLRDGSHAPALAELASNVPGPIPAPVPAPAPQAPAGRTSGGLAMDTGAWLAVIGGAAVAGIAIWGLVEAKSNHDDIKDLQTSINNLSTANTQLKNASNTSAIANTVGQLQSQQSAVASLAATASAALRNAGNTTAANTASSLAAQAGNLQNQLASLQGQISTLQAQIASGGGSAAQVSALLQQEEALRTAANSLATQLNTLLLQNASTPGVPNTTVPTVSGPAQASASVPI